MHVIILENSWHLLFINEHPVQGKRLSSIFRLSHGIKCFSTGVHTVTLVFISIELTAPFWQIKIAFFACRSAQK